MAAHLRNNKTKRAISRISLKKSLQAARQIGALVHRWNGETLEVLLVTSRETRRWILPKGWPVAGAPPAATAAREAEEEAGVIGHATKKPLGRYASIKRIGETILPSEVEVYALRFIKQKQKWKERGQRALLWLPAAEAADKVAEPELAAIIRDFAEDMQQTEVTPRSA